MRTLAVLRVLSTGALFGLAGVPTHTGPAWLLEGRIVRVQDGDTLTLLDAQHQAHTFRLSGIDAPELRQAFGQASRQALRARAVTRDARAICHKQDRYRRDICVVTINDQDLGEAQLAEGMAWLFTRYIRELPATARSSYAQAEARAQHDHRGLWSDGSAVAPWDWRDGRIQLGGAQSPDP